MNRTPAAAERLAALVTTAVPGAACEVAPWQALGGDLVAAQRLLVNATSLGMNGAGKVPAALADNVRAGQVVFDVVYTSAGTDLLARARQRGAVTVARPGDAALAGGRRVRALDRTSRAAGR